MSSQPKICRLSIPVVCFAFVVGLFVLSTGRSASAHDGPYKGEWTLPQGYPDGFDGYGHLLRIDSKVVVIDDSLHRLAPGVTFNTPGGASSTAAAFQPGALVGFMLSPDRQSVVSLWLIPVPPRQ